MLGEAAMSIKAQLLMLQIAHDIATADRNRRYGLPQRCLKTPDLVVKLPYNPEAISLHRSGFYAADEFGVVQFIRRPSNVSIGSKEVPSMSGALPTSNPQAAEHQVDLVFWCHPCVTLISPAKPFGQGRTLLGHYPSEEQKALSQGLIAQFYNNMDHRTSEEDLVQFGLGQLQTLLESAPPDANAGGGMEVEGIQGGEKSLSLRPLKMSTKCRDGNRDTISLKEASIGEMAHDTLPDLPSLSELRVFCIHAVVFATMVESLGTDHIGFELDESLLADIDACLALHNRVELAAAHNSAEDDSDDIMAYECG
ncbi:hypothetical protein CDV55_102489 [Aspergillus turcosus]|uniref:Uncharacterized protein n=1 Tax=Aspergillus turcosus TaxID=1245748 RepID=A0A229YJ62_9EURO|nr:hypothetical protein CDV55_102489 [Aspergillus turcosus]RLL94468.1 hypothetical protein CFD26_102854 [Aspergillus turcosus]